MTGEKQDIDRRSARVIALSSTDWFGTWMNRQNLMSRLSARGWQVLYSQGPLNLWHRRSHRFRHAPIFSEFRHSDGVTIDVAGRSLARWPSVGWWDRFVLARHAGRLANWAAGSNTILYIFEPEFAPYLRHFPTARVVYHPYDLFASMVGADVGQIRKHETMLVDRADLIIGTSRGVIDSLPSPGPQKALLLPNGANIAVGAGRAERLCPADLAKIPEPRIGYVGTINPKLDFRLLLAIASARPGYSFVFVGPDNMPFMRSQSQEVDVSDYERLRRLPNVSLLGGRPQDSVADYAANMTANLIPYVTEKGHWAAAGSPLKLFEYLAAARPVVSVALDMATSVHEVVGVARTEADWLREIDSAVTQGGVGDPARRIEVARKNSWDQRVDQLERWLAGIID